MQRLKQIGKKRLLVNVPYSLATIQSKIFELFPRPLLTFDQLKLLKFDNIVSGNYSSLKDLNLEYVSTFEEELDRMLEEEEKKPVDDESFQKGYEQGIQSVLRLRKV